MFDAWFVFLFTEKLELRLNNFLNQQCENVNETFPFLEGRSTIGAISVRVPDRHIPTLYMLAIHPILHKADLKDEKNSSNHGKLHRIN